MRSHNDVIAFFGGTSALARRIGITPARANQFPRRGIPAIYWPDVEREAQALGVHVTTQMLKDMALQQKITARRN
jgi:DNA-binding transcriptional regulator YdaS (Cro superfamily)